MDKQPEYHGHEQQGSGAPLKLSWQPPTFIVKSLKSAAAADCDHGEKIGNKWCHS